MPVCTFESAIIRVVPRVEREEFLNAGVLLSCPQHNFLEARIELNRARLEAFAPWLDLDLIEAHLQTIPLICGGGKSAGPLGSMAQRARFYWLTAPRSTMIQCSSVHSGLCENPEIELERLLQRMVRLPVENCGLKNSKKLFE